MKILAISDVHGEDNENLYKYLNNNDIDIVIITGDITNFGPLEFVDEFIGKILDCDCEVMAVPGNCDPAGICNAIRESDAICLHNNILSFDNVVLFGYGGSNPTPFDTPGEIQDNKIYGDVYELLANYDFVANDEQEESQKINTSELGARLLDLLKGGSLSLEELVEGSGTDFASVSMELLELQGAGLINQNQALRYYRR